MSQKGVGLPIVSHQPYFHLSGWEARQLLHQLDHLYLRRTIARNLFDDLDEDPPCFEQDAFWVLDLFPPRLALCGGEFIDGWAASVLNMLLSGCK